MSQSNKFLLKEIVLPEKGLKPKSAYREIVHGENNHLYIFDKLNGELWLYNISKNQFYFLISDEKKQLPQMFDVTIGRTYNRKLDTMVIMSIYEPNNSPMPMTYIHTVDLKKNVISKSETKGELNISFYPKNIIFHDNFYYAVPISNEEFYHDVYRFDVRNKLWECIYECAENRRESSPKVQAENMLIYDGKMIYCFNYDLNARELTSLTQISRFNLEQKQWNLIDTIGDDVDGYPFQRRYGALAQYNCLNGNYEDTFAVLSSGRNDEMVSFNDLWKLNLRTMKWSCISKQPLPYPLHGHSMHVNPSGRLFISGGYFALTPNHASFNAKFYSIWLKVPRLTDICWEAVLKYCPDLPFKSKKEIISIGIPWKFFQSRIL